MSGPFNRRSFALCQDMVFKFRKERYLPYILVWIVSDASKQCQEVLGHTRNGIPIEQVNVVAEICP